MTDQGRCNADLIESAYCDSVRTARLIFTRIDGAGPALLEDADKLAKLALAASEMIGKATEGLSQLAQLRDAAASRDGPVPPQDDPLARALEAYRKAVDQGEA